MPPLPARACSSYRLSMRVLATQPIVSVGACLITSDLQTLKERCQLSGHHRVRLSKESETFVLTLEALRVGRRPTQSRPGSGRTGAPIAEATTLQCERATSRLVLVNAGTEPYHLLEDQGSFLGGRRMPRRMTEQESQEFLADPQNAALTVSQPTAGP